MPAFIPDLSVILAFALAGFVLAITPGPDMALQMSRAINYGFWHGVATGFGAMTGLIVHTTFAALGVSVLIVAAPPLFMALKIAGAAYLIWLAFQAITKGGGLRLAERAKKVPTLWQSYLSGIGVNLLNPKVVLFFVTFFPQFVDAHDPAAPQKLFFLGAEFIVLSIPLMVLTVYFARLIADAFRRTKWVERAINWAFAGIFATFAAVILTAQARH
ncbi:MAG TPA: LysE family translocator [Devosia sp.]|nr:LysE family translocator [Devosia sp.]